MDFFESNSNQSFIDLITGDDAYIDKTEQIVELYKDHDVFELLLRPFGFGKTVLLDTIYHMFAHPDEPLLQNLSYKSYDIKLPEHLIIKLDFGSKPFKTPDDLKDLTNIINLENLGEVKIRNKIMNDDIVIDDFIKKKGFDESDLQIRLLLLDLCLISNGKSLNEMYTMAEEGIVTAEDIVAIEDWFSHAIWGVQEKVNVKCPDCGKEESRGYILALEDFFSAL